MPSPRRWRAAVGSWDHAIPFQLRFQGSRDLERAVHVMESWEAREMGRGSLSHRHHTVSFQIAAADDYIFNLHAYSAESLV